MSLRLGTTLAENRLPLKYLMGNPLVQEPLSSSSSLASTDIVYVIARLLHHLLN